MARVAWLTLKTLAVGLLAVSTTALAATASTQETRGVAASNAVNESRLNPGTRRLAAATDMLRAAFVLDMASAWQGLAPDERAHLRLAIGPEQATTAAALGWFMHGAAVRIGGADLTGLYNPIADVWLVLYWRSSGGVPRLAAAFLVPGTDLRPDTEADRWSGSDAPYASALAAGDARAAARFLELGEAGPVNALVDWLDPRRTALRQQAFAQIAPWLDGLRGVRRIANWRRLHSRLVAASGFAASLTSVPTYVRRSLIPLATIRRGDRPSLLLGSPLAPGQLVAVDDPGGTAGVQLIELTGGSLTATGESR